MSDSDATQTRQDVAPDRERIAYIVGWLNGFEPMVWALVGERLGDDTADEYSRIVYELAALLGVQAREAGE